MICKVTPCERVARSKGLCFSHYQRWRRNGDPGDTPIRYQSSQLDDLAVRLEAWSAKVGSCRIWKGHTNGDGYPTLNWKGRNRFAHRLAYELANGPTDLPLDHLCRTPACINPEHLEPVPQAVNVQRGRLAVLDPAAVVAIRKSYAKGEKTQSEIAAVFGVGRQTISNVVTRKTWRNI